MSSERRARVLVAAVVTAAACASSGPGPKPPTFSDGGLVARSKAPPNPWSFQNALEGVYDTTSRFGANVVIHASQWGASDEGVKASVSILAADHFAFAVMQPGCFLDTSGATPITRLVLEGYWRYLDDPDPSPSTTGLVRLFVSPQEIVDYVCNAPPWDKTAPPGDPRPAPAAHATLTGGTGQGNDDPGAPLSVTWVRPRKSRLAADGKPSFFVGVHHGGCVSTDNCGVSENTPETAILATQLGGDYLELDIHLTKDEIPVVFHLGLSPAASQGVYCKGQIEDSTYSELLANCRLPNGEVIPRVDETLEIVFTRTDFPVYLDSKSPDVIVPVSQILGQLQQKLVACNPRPANVANDAPWPPPGKKCLFPGSGPVFQRGVIGLPADDYVAAYRQASAAGQLAPNQHCLVEVNVADATGVPCVAWMPRYTRGPMESDVAMLQQQGLFVGFWTINDPATIDTFLVTAHPNGILTNYLGLLNQRFEAVGVAPSISPYKVVTP